MSLKLITPPTTFPVTEDECKAQSKITTTADDTLLTSYIAVATAHVETVIGRSIMPQTWQQHLDGFQDTMLLPKGPVQSVSFVKYYDEDSVLQTLDPAVYAVDNVADNGPHWLLLKADQAWPATACGANVVFMEYDTGFTTVPLEIKQAIILLVEHYYDNRMPVLVGSGAFQLEFTIDALLANHKSYW